MSFAVQQETGFHVAVVNGKIDDVRMLLRDGVDVNVRTVRQVCYHVQHLRCPLSMTNAKPTRYVT